MFSLRPAVLQRYTDETLPRQIHQFLPALVLGPFAQAFGEEQNPSAGLRWFVERSCLQRGEHSAFTSTGLFVALSLRAASLLFGTRSSVVFNLYSMS